MIFITLVLIGLVLVIVGSVMLAETRPAAGPSTRPPRRWRRLVARWAVATAVSAIIGVMASQSFVLIPTLTVILIFWSPLPSEAGEVATLVTLVGCAVFPSLAVAIGHLLALGRWLRGLWPTLLAGSVIAWLNGALLRHTMSSAGEMLLFQLSDTIISTGLVSAALFSITSWVQVLWPDRSQRALVRA